MVHSTSRKMRLITGHLGTAVGSILVILLMLGSANAITVIYGAFPPFPTGSVVRTATPSTGGGCDLSVGVGNVISSAPTMSLTTGVITMNTASSYWVPNTPGCNPTGSGSASQSAQAGVGMLSFTCSTPCVTASYTLTAEFKLTWNLTVETSCTTASSMLAEASIEANATVVDYTSGPT